MYNRYVPQRDGTYRRDRIEEPPPAQQRPAYSPAAAPPAPEPPVGQPATDFLRRLLPKNLDTEDLLIIMLLLLMSGDGKESRSTALLTLALYFFL